MTQFLLATEMETAIQHQQLRHSGGQLEYYLAEPQQIVRPPVILLHGVLSDARLFTYHLLPALAEAGYPAIALSLRGHGQSRVSDGLSGLKAYLNDVEQTVAWAEQRYQVKPVVVGFSLGGLIAQHYAHNHPDKLQGLALMASAPPQGLERLSMELMIREPILATALSQLMLFPGLALFNPFYLLAAQQMLFAGQPSHSQLNELRRSVKAEALSIFTEQTELKTPLHEALPMLVIGASEDRLVSPQQVRQTAEFHQRDCAFVEGAGHAIPIENEWRQALTLLLEWLKPLS